MGVIEGIVLKGVIEVLSSRRGRGRLVVGVVVKRGERRKVKSERWLKIV
jgi:hypothetical protein